MKRIYLDHNATTPMRPEARGLFLSRLDELGGNPSSSHRSGRIARQWIDDARERTAAALGVDEDEIVFTSGGTESNNLAILGTLRALPPDRGLVTTAIEHSSVLGAAEQLEKEGRPVHRSRVDAEGRPDLDEIVSLSADPNCALLTVMAANNEVGTVPRLDRLDLGGRAARAHRPLFHTDAVQALGRVPVRLREWGVDLASFSAHKVGGPLGAGILYRRKSLSSSALFFGGWQEHGSRPGTENVPAICAAALAVELAVAEQASFQERLRRLSEALWRGLLTILPDAKLVGPSIQSEDRLPNTLNVSIPDVDGRVLVTRLDLEGLEVSAGSACASGSLEPSHVLLAMGFSPERARASLRLSLGRTTTIEEIHTAVEILRRTFLPAR